MPAVCFAVRRERRSRIGASETHAVLVPRARRIRDIVVRMGWVEHRKHLAGQPLSRLCQQRRGYGHDAYSDHRRTHSGTPAGGTGRPRRGSQAAYATGCRCGKPHPGGFGRLAASRAGESADQTTARSTKEACREPGQCDGRRRHPEHLHSQNVVPWLLVSTGRTRQAARVYR